MSAEREAADEKLVKKLKLEKAPTFRKKGHEKQYRHNEEVHVRLKLSNTHVVLDKQPPAVEKEKSLLEEGEKLIVERQKHIRIADHSDNGWATVEETCMWRTSSWRTPTTKNVCLGLMLMHASKKFKSTAQKNRKLVKRPGPKGS